MAKVKRIPKNQAVMGTSDVLTISFNPRAGALKIINSGPEIRKTSVSGLAALDASSPLSLNPGTLLAIYNNSSSVIWVNMNRSAEGTLTAPTGPANAYPLKPNDWTYLSMGENDRIQTSSSSALIYIIEDETSLQVLPADAIF